MSEPRICALIPARGGSKRIPRKNTKDFCGQPLLAWTIEAAKASGVFGDRVYVSTEDEHTSEVAEHYGAKLIQRSPELAADLAPDIGWVNHAVMSMEWVPEAFAILRPTSPFRSAETIRTAWDHLRAHGMYAVDSLRAVEPTKQHPFKMWVEMGAFIMPLTSALPTVSNSDVPAHSMPTQAHQRFLAQNAALEMAWSHVALGEHPTISGTRILPWTMPGYEGFDLNTEDDWAYAEWLVESGRVTLPELVSA